jgi:hypothetical protein
MELVGGLKITIRTLKFLSQTEKHILILVVGGLYVVKASVNVHSIRLTKKNEATMICKKEIKSYFESMMEQKWVRHNRYLVEFNDDVLAA